MKPTKRTGPACSENGILGMSNAEMATKRKQGAAKAEVMYALTGPLISNGQVLYPNSDYHIPVAALPLPLPQSRKLVAFARLTEEEKVERAALAAINYRRKESGYGAYATHCNSVPHLQEAAAILREIGLLEEGKP